MKGNNEITLNEATMLEALNYYYDKVILKRGSFKFTSIVFEQTCGVKSFKCRIESPGVIDDK